jgi:hypothetical protein
VSRRFTSTVSAVSLFLVLLPLKLSGVVSWSWWWITCPLWGPLAVFLASLLVFLAVNVATRRRI